MANSQYVCWRNALCVATFIVAAVFLHRDPSLPGFIPILFPNLFKSKRNQPLLVEEDESEIVKDQPLIPLAGWKVCWLWLPALCDLTATTVSVILNINIRPK